MIILYGVTFDCADPGAVAAFWRAALDYVQRMPTPEELEAAYAAHPEWRSMAVVEDELARHPRLLLQTVREPKTGRNRVRFEVSLPNTVFEAEVGRLVSLGARRIGRLLADPDGNEFEVRPGADGVRRMSAIVIDAKDPDRLKAFWSTMLGFVPVEDRCDPPSDWLRVESGRLYAFGTDLGTWFPGDARPADGPVHVFTPGFRFPRTDEPKIRKNRIHLDLVYVGDVMRDRARAFSLGASPEDLAGTGHRGMFDPEGNEFCLHDDSMFE